MQHSRSPRSAATPSRLTPAVALRAEPYPFGDTSFQTYIGALEAFGVRYAVFCRVSFDGVEYIGRLWFAEPGEPQRGVPDRAAIPGRTRESVLERARQLTAEELGVRQRRAMAERRQYLRLRRLAEDMLDKVRYINQVAIALKTGILDAEAAAHEFALTERQLHEQVDQLRSCAGVTD